MIEYSFSIKQSGEESADALLHVAILALVTRARQIHSHQSEVLVAIVEAILRHLSMTPLCCEWLLAVIPENTWAGIDRSKRARKHKPRHPH